MRRLFPVAVLILCGALCGITPAARTQEPPPHDLSVVARRYEFVPSRLDVHLGDLVRVTVRSEDIAHSFVIDAYRIAKRVPRGGSVSVEFLADQPGEFRFYCDLHAEEGCRHMAGTLLVTGAKAAARR